MSNLLSQRRIRPLEFGAEPMIVEIGPSHPVTHGITRLTTHVDGEVIVKMDVDMGYLHRGFEKESESGTYIQVMPYTDRLNYVSPLLNNIGYAMAVEKLFNLEVPKRAQYARVIMGEMSRLCDHLTCNGATAMEMGAMTVFLYYVKAREYLWEAIDEMTGARMTTNWARFGGNANDFPEGYFTLLEARLKKVEKVLDEQESLLLGNRIFHHRTVGVGIVERQRAIELGFTGPMLRATGEAYDLRRAEPYLVYDELDFEVPVGTVGDCWDRYLVRNEEMRQSIKIIRQAMQKIPPGDYINRDRHAWIPDKSRTYNSIEGLIDHFKIIMEGSAPPPGEVYQAIEAGNGELGYYLVSDGTGKPYKCRVRPPCMNFTAALGEMAQGHYVGDIVPIFGSINMIAGELER